MKKLVIYLALCFSSGALKAQSGEFTIHENGLIYSDTTMHQLAFIVDSLNLKFKMCELDKTYLSKQQGRAHYISLAEGDLKGAKKDLKNGLSFGEFVKKYPKAEVRKDVLVVRYDYINYHDEKVVEYSSVVADYTIYPDNAGSLNFPKKGTWIFQRNPKTDYSQERISAFYLVSDMESEPMNERYARMVQYSECMVDTSTQIFKEDARESGVRYENKMPSKVANFMDYISDEAELPEVNYDEEDAWRKLRELDSLKYVFIDEELSKKKEFIVLLDAAVGEALDKGGTDSEFERLVELYHSKEAALELKRSRIVVGGCSMDASPRYHAIDIAKLSAETVNWEVFLRAHLDIMNDNFRRVSDGSWAWAGRKTYIKELEELEINVQDLLLGISLRVENPSQNHYYGSIGRIGRALSETKYEEEIKSAMLSMIEDHSLDDLNRVLIYYLFLNYNHYLEDQAVQKVNETLLAAAVEKLPNYLVNRIKSIDTE
jgi:hypothetical protein